MPRNRRRVRRLSDRSRSLNRVLSRDKKFDRSLVPRLRSHQRRVRCPSAGPESGRRLIVDRGKGRRAEAMEAGITKVVNIKAVTTEAASIVRGNSVMVNSVMVNIRVGHTEAASIVRAVNIARVGISTVAVSRGGDLKAITVSGDTAMAVKAGIKDSKADSWIADSVGRRSVARAGWGCRGWAAAGICRG